MIPAILNLYTAHDKQPCKYHNMISLSINRYTTYLHNRLNIYFYNTFYRKYTIKPTKQPLFHDLREDEYST